MYKICLVEDEYELNQILCAYLRKEDWQVISFTDGNRAREYTEDCDLWILDIMLPGCDGFTLLQEIRVQKPDIPIIFISARDKDIDRLAGLELGSDDYVTKPFLPRELVLRVKKLMTRRSGNTATDTNASSQVISQNGYHIDCGSRTVLDSANKTIELTSKEFDLLVFMLRNHDIAVNRDSIIHAVWGEDYVGTDRAVDDLLRRLRKKLPTIKIETIYGYGYKLVK